LDKIPNNQDLNKYGHNIEQLFSNVSEQIRPKSDFLNKNDLYPLILNFLSEYARVSRYHNLDSLTGIETSSDPLHKWKDIQNIIYKRHCKPISLSLNEISLLNIFEQSSSIVASNEYDEPILNIVDYYMEGKDSDKIQGYSVFYIFQIIRHIVELLNEISGKKYLMPVLSEFFPLYTGGMKTKEIIQKKNWNFISQSR
jgi:hypothetical protein